MAVWSCLNVHLCPTAMLMTQWQHHDSNSTQSSKKPQIIRYQQKHCMPLFTRLHDLHWPRSPHWLHLLLQWGSSQRHGQGLGLLGSPKFSSSYLQCEEITGVWGSWEVSEYNTGYKMSDRVSCCIEVEEGGGHRGMPRITLLWGGPKPSTKSGTHKEEGTEGTRREKPSSPLTVPLDPWPKRFPSKESSFEQFLLLFWCHSHEWLFIGWHVET